MNEVIAFLDSLKKEFPNMFEVKDGAPIDEFWESFDAAYQAAQQSVQLTDGGRAQIEVESVAAHQPLTQDRSTAYLLKEF